MDIGVLCMYKLAIAIVRNLSTLNYFVAPLHLTLIKSAVAGRNRSHPKQRFVASSAISVIAETAWKRGSQPEGIRVYALMIIVHKSTRARFDLPLWSRGWPSNTLHNRVNPLPDRPEILAS